MIFTRTLYAYIASLEVSYIQFAIDYNIKFGSLNHDLNNINKQKNDINKWLLFILSTIL